MLVPWNGPPPPKGSPPPDKKNINKLEKNNFTSWLEILTTIYSTIHIKILFKKSSEKPLLCLI